MALMFADSFDLSTSAGLIAGGQWTTNVPNFAVSSASTRWGVGQSLFIGVGTSYIVRSGLPASSSVVYLAFSAALPSKALTVAIYDGALAVQCSVVVDIADITVKNTAGTVIATYAGGSGVANWTHYQFRIVISNTAGEVRCRKNGSLTDSWVSANNLNTRGGTSNAQATAVGLTGATSSSIYVDDFMMFDSSGAAPNDWVGDVRGTPLYPTANTSQKDFVSTPTVVTPYSSTASTLAVGADTLYVTPSFASSLTGVINSVTVNLSAGFTGNLNVALYDATGATVLGTATAISNPAAGLNTLAFSSPPAVVAGTSYRIGTLSDASVTFYTSSTMNSSTSASHTYASGFPASPTYTGGQKDRYTSYNITPNNFSSVNEAICDSDTTFNYSSTVNAEDLYTIGSVPTSSNIIFAQLRVTARKSDAGARGAESVLSSAGTVDTGTEVLLGSGYSTLFKAYPTDPHTSAAWTAANINAVQIGAKVSS